MLQRRKQDPYAKRGLLKGTDVKASGVMFIDFEVLDIRAAPDGFSSDFIIDFKEYLCDKGSFPVNQTNAQIIESEIQKVHKLDDLEMIRGAKIRLAVVKANNPQTKKETWGLRVHKMRLKKKPTAAPVTDVVLGSAGELGLSDDDIPF